MIHMLIITLGAIVIVNTYWVTPIEFISTLRLPQECAPLIRWAALPPLSLENGAG